ncbi:hypothetical protein HG536_0B05370 [Torulaspora globosa]|uniref:Uncharacterized protein n=1 Tax=Torulaspora globosa TaxID=48254 RepID=A0A7G3ZDT6_9SACH|nr:uncharacterized protein HG536_0B05370 [Torulaspora globosa]QLL31672.1 hypothetical protein HG536_0B05370 [Torulaspora globosa]
MVDGPKQSEGEQASMATYRISTGRGGAGNIQNSSSKASPKLIPQGSQTPNILQPVFSTGRGGAGNMRRNVDAKLTRRAQDVDGELEEDVIEPSREEDYIGPFSGSEVERALSGGVISRGTGSHETGKSHVRNGRSRRNSLDDRPMAIAVGRGGAGNIISPKPSGSGARKNKTGKQQKQGVWSSLKKLFS